MIDINKYDNEGIELSDGGTICFPEDDGRIQRIDYDGNTMESRYPEADNYAEWYELFDTPKELLAEVKRLHEALRITEKHMNFNHPSGDTDEWSWKVELHDAGVCDGAGSCAVCEERDEE